MTHDDSKPNPKNDPSLWITRKRVGRISRVEINKQFGFIEAEDYRNDVFFHFRQWEPDESNSLPKLDQVVEFEIDELHRREEGKLRVKWIRPTNRPLGTKMLARSTPHLMVKHHPKARQSKPSWRGKNKKSDD